MNAILIRFSVSMFNNSRQDAQITAETKKRFKLNGKAGRWLKYKLPEEAMEVIRSVAGQIRAWHYEHTLSWEEGLQLLPNAMREQYDKEMEEHRAVWAENVEEFLAQYPQWIEHAKIMHGPTFVQADYPDAAKVRDTFKFTIERLPVPSGSHFTSELRALYAQDLEAANQRRIEEASASLFQRILEPVQKLAEKLTEREPVFRDSLIDNIREVLQLVPALNVTGNSRITTAAAEIQRRLATLNPDDLRAENVVRKQALNSATAILSQFGQMGVRRLAA